MRKVKIKQGYSEECTYDDCGRLIAVESSAGVTSLSWNYEDRLIGITYPNSSTNSFGYNPFGARVSKSDSSGTSTYFRAGTSVVSPVLSDGSATYTPGISERRNNNSTYYHPDLKNTTAQTASNETVSGTNQYDAFGNLVNYTGDWNGPFSYGGAFGYQADDDSGLMLLGHRYYDSSTGRFLSRDPIGDGSNWYVYCEGNPVSNFDNKGLFSVNLLNPSRLPILGPRPVFYPRRHSHKGETQDPLDSRVYIRENGTPPLAPKGTFMVLDEEHILLPEGVSSHDFLNSPDYVKYYNHEAGHIEQARVLGPLYVPTYLLSWVLVGFSYERHPMGKYANERAEILKDTRVPPGLGPQFSLRYVAEEIAKVLRPIYPPFFEFFRR